MEGAPGLLAPVRGSRGSGTRGSSRVCLCAVLAMVLALCGPGTATGGSAVEDTTVYYCTWVPGNRNSQVQDLESGLSRRESRVPRPRERRKWHEIRGHPQSRNPEAELNNVNETAYCVNVSVGRVESLRVKTKRARARYWTSTQSRNPEAESSIL